MVRCNPTVTGTDDLVAPLQDAPRLPIDIERLVQWAVARSGKLPWDRTRDRELAFDRGLTARHRRRPRTIWLLAEATAGLSFGRGRSAPARMTPSPDAEQVFAAIKRLDPAVVASVIACARSKIRPDWMPGVEPKLVPREVSRKHKRGHRRKLQVRLVWEPCDPAVVRAVRDQYGRWHKALSTLLSALRGALDGWELTGFEAPSEPWLVRAIDHD
jgi:hypothetical protein